MIHDYALSPQYRREAWQRLSEQQVDVLVVGGGVTGAGTALDATTRGLRTALVEARDWASGTSSRSSKLFHGGLRYLEKMDFGLVREALHERELSLTRLCPHLVKPVPFLYPLEHRVWERPYVGAGLALYDTMGGARSVPLHKHLTRRGARALAPAIKKEALVGALRYYDAQADDARHTLSVVRTAARYGATVRSSTEVVRMLTEADRVIGAEVRDVETGETTQVRAKVVVNCTGVWTDSVQEAAGRARALPREGQQGRAHRRAARPGPPARSGSSCAPRSRCCSSSPGGSRWIIGTTDTEWNLDLAHPAATKADIDYILERANKVLSVPLTRDDIQGVYAGLRPLLVGESEDTSSLSREHAVARPQPGMVSIAGGKYTTYRVMAADAVDALATDLGELRDSVTEHVPLVGADGYHALVNQLDELAGDAGVPVWRMEHLLNRYGSLTTEVLRAAEREPSLLEPLEGAEEYLRAEIRYGATHEGALHLDDLLARRTRLSIEYAHRGTQTARPAADLVADVLGWDDERAQREVDTYTERVRAEKASQELPDDEAADAARRSAPDSRPALVA